MTDPALAPCNPSTGRRIENGRRHGRLPNDSATFPPTVALARGLIHGQHMAKTKKRLETASIDRPTAMRGEGNNGEHAETGENARDRIALRAYELYLARGCADGGDFDDWLAAERELTGTNAQRSDRRE